MNELELTKIDFETYNSAFTINIKCRRMYCEAHKYWGCRGTRCLHWNTCDQVKDLREEYNTKILKVRIKNL